MVFKEKVSLQSTTLRNGETVFEKEQVEFIDSEGLSSDRIMILNHLKGRAETLGPSPYDVMKIYHPWGNPEDILLTLKGKGTKTKDISRKYLRKYN